MKASSISVATALICVGNASSTNGDVKNGAARCSVYIAKSTIENAGVGVFTAVPLREGDHVGFGDMTIPIYDLDFHAGGSRDKEDYHWLLDEYAWDSRHCNPHMTQEAEKVSAFVLGMGSSPNCHFRLKNIREMPNEHDNAGISRADPGMGAFTPYINRTSLALSDLQAGQELFVDYGITWFQTRESYMGMVPLIESYPKASEFITSFQKLFQTVSSLLEGNSRSTLEEIMADFFDVMRQSPYKSRPFAAVPKSWSALKRAFEIGVKQTEAEDSIRSLEYLEKHGRCLDNIRPGKSRIPHAGRGAFATRFIQKGSYVGIAQLAHIPDRDVLAMYADEVDPETGEETGMRDKSKPTGHQLMMNYCFGHNSSTMMLCPYSSGTSFINHDRTSPNTKIVWAADSVFQTSSWLDEPVSFFDNIWHGGLAFEYIATADIQPGDEITLDYGPEWEEAWQVHVQQWRPPENADSYRSPQEFNEDHSLPIPTLFEDKTFADGNLALWCHFSQNSVEAGEHNWQEHDMEGTEHKVQRVIDRVQIPSDQSYIYSLEIIVEEDRSKAYRISGVPRKALWLSHNNYKSDLFIEGIFRHEMMIPDEIFPDAWKNSS